MHLKNIAIDASIMSLNIDEIHIGQSNRVNITGADIDTGDDYISLGDGRKHINNANIACGLGHGISVESLGRYRDEQPVPSRVRISDVLLKDIQGTSAAEMTMQLTCNKSMLCQNAKLGDIDLKYIGMDKNVKNAISQCPMLSHPSWCLRGGEGMQHLGRGEGMQSWKDVPPTIHLQELYHAKEST
ncbi:hypothetical protein Cgig2_010231 [Carnegiea gigantea]|uniref:Uncharacterized protein n=1 Tax=Carnegiea gigantea TaxID=171969 RepID=A0A9Q1JWG1_9CARY|nr:hypothetical protein Cgig2_010231 [Carnegiea gigantea]